VPALTSNLDVPAACRAAANNRNVTSTGPRRYRLVPACPKTHRELGLRPPPSHCHH
jgi:hypothetical protein